MRLAVLVLFLASICNVQAQQSGPQLGQEYPLEKLGDWALLGGHAKRCSEYFVLTGETKYPDGKSGAVTFLSVDTSRNFWEFRLIITGWDKIVTMIDEAKKVPTATYRPELEGPVPFTWTIRINKKDLESAKPCIPDPTQR